MHHTWGYVVVQRYAPPGHMACQQILYGDTAPCGAHHPVPSIMMIVSRSQPDHHCEQQMMDCCSGHSSGSSPAHTMSLRLSLKAIRSDKAAWWTTHSVQHSDHMQHTLHHNQLLKVAEVFCHTAVHVCVRALSLACSDTFQQTSAATSNTLCQTLSHICSLRPHRSASQ